MENICLWQSLVVLLLVSNISKLQAVFQKIDCSMNFSVATFLSCLFPDTTGTKNLTTIDEAIKFYAGELDDEDEDDENIKFIQ